MSFSQLFYHESTQFLFWDSVFQPGWKALLMVENKEQGKQALNV